jgi:hypothetical protein
MWFVRASGLTPHVMLAVLMIGPPSLDFDLVQVAQRLGYVLIE